jgi:3-vinyl bacteriochlorophyllide hydratase
MKPSNSPAPASSGPTDPPQRKGLYTPEERVRRDASRWTLVQGVLAPLQFVVMIGSAVLLVRFLVTGEGLVAAEASVVIKTALLYLIMVTGSIWEKEVFGKWLFAPAFFWEDVVSMGVIALHTWYLIGLFSGGMSATALAWLALVAYAAYAVNAVQFVLKLRAARLQERADGRVAPPGLTGRGEVPA